MLEIMDTVLIVLGVGGLLLALWLAATRTHLRRRQVQSGEWDAADRPELWTSGARCPHCGAHGGLLEVEDEKLWFECLACGRRHQRQTRA